MAALLATILRVRPATTRRQDDDGGHYVRDVGADGYGRCGLSRRRSSLNLAALGGAGSIVGTPGAGDGAPLTSKGQAVEFGIDAGTIIGYVDNDGNNALSAGDRLVFRLAQTAGAATTGDPTDDQFTVTLLDQIDHLPNVPANDDSQTLSLDLSGVFLATDKDNDSIQLTSAVTVVVEDDIPVNTRRRCRFPFRCRKTR